MVENQETVETQVVKSPEVGNECPCSFPNRISFDCALHLAKSAKDGSLFSDWSKNTKHLACFLGSVGNQFGYEHVHSALDGMRSVQSSADKVCDDAITAIEGSEQPESVGDAKAIPFWVLPLLKLLFDRLVGGK